MGDMRRAALAIGCGDSDLRARIASKLSEGGRGSNISRVEIVQMAERQGRAQGTTGQRKCLLLQRGHHDDDVGAR